MYFGDEYIIKCVHVGVERTVNNTVHKVELRADSKGSRQRVGELHLKFSGIELDLGALTASTNGDSHRGMYISMSRSLFSIYGNMFEQLCSFTTGIVLPNIYFAKSF